VIRPRGWPRPKRFAASPLRIIPPHVIGMETFAPPREFVEDPHYAAQREQALSGLDVETIDRPLRGLIADFAALEYCFTLQSCYGHFLYGDQKDEKNVEPLPAGRRSGLVEYRIAYLALCIERSEEGRGLYRDLQDVATIDPAYVQFGSAGWFWHRRVNSYALQVEPERYRNRDKIRVPFHEARRIETVRNAFFARIVELVDARLHG
jgi:hypothetical protein